MSSASALAYEYVHAFALTTHMCARTCVYVCVRICVVACMCVVCARTPISNAALLHVDWSGMHIDAWVDGRIIRWNMYVIFPLDV